MNPAMNAPTPDRFPSDASLDDAAAEWLCEREEGFTPERARAFAAWCASDPRHTAAVARVEQALALLDELPAVRGPLEARVGGAERIDGFGQVGGQPGATRETAVPAGASPDPESNRRGRVLRFPPSRWIGGLAAALVVGVSAWWITAPGEPAVESYATEAATQRRITLGDGSVVDLNAGSELRVQLLPAERRITLRAGEAHFQVAHDAARPFIVTAAGVAVRAVGTAFNVRVAPSEVAVLVTEGKVQVRREDSATDRGSAQAGPTPANASPAAAVATLTARECTVVALTPKTAPAAEAPRVEVASVEQLQSLRAWQDPVVTFADAPLRDVVSRFNRRNATQLRLADAALAERKIGGVIALDQVDAFVRLLEQDGDVVAERRGATEIVLRRAR